MGFLDLLFGTPPQPEERAFSISDKAFAEWLAMQGLSTGELTHSQAMGITAYYRGVSIIAGTIAGLPMKSYQDLGDDQRERVATFLDRPAGPYKIVPFTWKEMVVLHLVTQGEAFLLHVRNQAGAIIGLWPIHPLAVSDVKWKGTTKEFTVQLEDGGTQTLTDDDVTQVLGLTEDGLRGTPLVTLFRRVIKTGVALDLATYNIANRGLGIAGLVTPEGDLDEEEAKDIKKSLDNRMGGPENAGTVAVINRALKFTPMQMTAADAEFLGSREFNVTEFARMLGIPPHLLAQTEKQTSWGTGVAEQNLGLARYTLMGWTSRLEEALTDLLPTGVSVEFEYKGLLRGSPGDEIHLLIEQVDAGLLTVEEARRILNRPPLPALPAPEEEPAADAA